MNYELHYRDEGNDVLRLQEFFVTNERAPLSADGLFGPNTRDAIIRFQQRLGLNPTGWVDPTLSDALASKGLVFLSPPVAGASLDLAWPPRPAQPLQPTSALTTSLFGKFDFRRAPTATNPERIEILDGWEANNIVEVRIPQLDQSMFAASNHHARVEIGKIRCHRLAAAAFQALFDRWETAGLMDRIVSCAGSFNARLKRGSTSAKAVNLSNHSWGTAIDLNARENPLGHVPVGVGARGSVRELVAIANGLGFFWGGHYASRPDGMHFELAELP